jgi:hypothetical protein
VVKEFQDAVKITAKERALLGLFNKGYARTIALPELEQLTKQDVKIRQGNGFCKAEYNVMLTNVYDDSWRRATFQCRREYPMPSPGIIIPNPEGYWSLVKQMLIEGGVNDKEEDETGSLRHEEEAVIVEETRTVTHSPYPRIRLFHCRLQSMLIRLPNS